MEKFMERFMFMINRENFQPFLPRSNLEVCYECPTHFSVSSFTTHLIDLMS